MCEPAHSIVQYPDQPDEDQPFSGQATQEQIIQAVSPSFLIKWAKKIGSWFHVSRLGGGHSETIRVKACHYHRLPTPIKYEGLWWERLFTQDGHAVLIPGQENAAHNYFNLVAAGNIQTLRRFLETSMRVSDIPEIYADRVFEMLTPQGRDIFRKIRAKVRYNYGSTFKERLIDATVGITRRRNLLIPRWADK